jgi:Rrf2 family protein
MALNCRFAVAVHVLAAIAEKGERVSSAELADNFKTNPVVVRRLLADLQRAGLVESCKGVNGGTVLARPAGKISLAEIYRAVDEDAPFHIPEQRNPDCVIACKVQKTLAAVLDRADEAMQKELRRTRLADVLSK